MRPLKISTQITDRTSASIKKYFAEVTEIPLLDSKEEYKLAMKVFKSGDEHARQKIIKSNLRFVVSVAKQYHAVNRNMILDDLISAGNEGLIIASEKFDPTKGFKFISYAVWHIRAKIIEYLNKNARTIKTSAKMVNDVSRIKSTMVEMEQRFEREPTFDELFKYQEICDTEEALEKILIASNINVNSFDVDLGSGFSDSSYTMLDSLSSDEKEDIPSFDIENIENKSSLIKLLDTYLSERESDIIVHLFGIDGNDIQSVNYLTKKYNLGSASIINYKKLALRKLKYKLTKNNQVNILDL